MAHQGQLTQREKYDDVLRRGIGQAVQQAANRTIPTKAQQFGKMAPLSSAAQPTQRKARNKAQEPCTITGLVSAQRSEGASLHANRERRSRRGTTPFPNATPHARKARRPVSRASAALPGAAMSSGLARSAGGLRPWVSDPGSGKELLHVFFWMLKERKGPTVSKTHPFPREDL